MLITPGAAPPMLTQQSRTARPMVALARQPGPNTPAPELMSSLARIGPFTITSGATASVVPETPSRQKRSSHIASTTATTTGRYSGRQPAITALIATFWTVARPNRGGLRDHLVGRAAHRRDRGHPAPGGRRYHRDQDARVADDLVGPARHEDGLDVRAEGEEPVAELLAVDARHHDVGQDHVDGAGVLLRDPEGTLPVLGLQDPISRADQDVAGQVPHLGLIVHQQDRLHPSSILPPGAPLSRTRRRQPPDPSADSARSP